MKKPFTYVTKKEKNKKEMEKNFPGSTKENEYSSYRDGTPQTLKEALFDEDEKTTKVVYNVTKLQEFLGVINQIKSSELSVNVMKENLYNDENFFNVLQEYSFGHNIFSNNNVVNFLLPASYYGHEGILEWLIKERGLSVKGSNSMGQTGLHLGIMHFFLIFKIV